MWLTVATARLATPISDRGFSHFGGRIEGDESRGHQRRRGRIGRGGRSDGSVHEVNRQGVMICDIPYPIGKLASPCALPMMLRKDGSRYRQPSSASVTVGSLNAVQAWRLPPNIR